VSRFFLSVAVAALSLAHANVAFAHGGHSVAPVAPAGEPAKAGKKSKAKGGEGWLAGDHHIHSRFSVGSDEKTNPPTPIMGTDSPYPTAMNATMAFHGLLRPTMAGPITARFIGTMPILTF
jgi:hypothetical protein